MSDQSMNREELARRLLEDPAQNWPDDLKGLDVELRPMPPALRQKLVGLANSSDRVELKTKSSSEVSEKRTVLRMAGAALIGAVAATVVLYLAIFRGEAPHATLVFADGNIVREARQLRTGDRLYHGDRISAGDQSLAVLTARDASRQTLFRLRGSAELSFEILQSDLIEARLGWGRIYAKVPANAPADAPADRWPLKIVTPLAIASVRGTEFIVESSRADTVLATQAGAVEFRRRWAALEDLPPQLFEQSEFLSQVRQVFIDASSTVPAGSQSIVSAPDFTRRFARAGEIVDALGAAPFADLQRRPSATEAELKAALADLEQKFPTPGARAQSLRLLKAAFGDPPALQLVRFKDMQERRFNLIEPAHQEAETRYLEL